MPAQVETDRYLPKLKVQLLHRRILPVYFWDGGFFLLKWLHAIISSADVYPAMRAAEGSPRTFQSETLHSAENNSPLCRIDEILQRPQDRAREGILRLSESIPYKRVRSSGSHFRGEEISSQGSSFASYPESNVLLDSSGHLDALLICLVASFVYFCTRRDELLPDGILARDNRFCPCVHVHLARRFLYAIDAAGRRHQRYQPRSLQSAEPH